MIKIKDSWGIAITVVSIIVLLVIGAVVLTAYRKAEIPVFNVIYNDTNQDYSYSAPLRYKVTKGVVPSTSEAFSEREPLLAQSESVVPFIPLTYLESITLYKGDTRIGCFMVETGTARKTGSKSEQVFTISSLKKRCGEPKLSTSY